MAKLSDRACATTKPKEIGDVLLGDGDGLWLQIRLGGSRSWFIDYVVKGQRRKVTIGNYHPKGGNSQDLNTLLDGGLITLAQARSIASEWKQLRRAGRDPIAEWDIRKAAEKAQHEADMAQPTVAEAVERFFKKNIEGKRSACHVKYRLDRLASSSLGNKKIREVKRIVFWRIATGRGNRGKLPR